MLENWPTHSRIVAPVLGGLTLVMMVAQGFVTGDDWQFHSSYWGLAVGLVIAYWLETDTSRTRLMRVYDREFFFFIGWPFILPYYLIKTRGLRKGLTIMFEWIGAYFVLAAISVLFK